MEVLVYVRIFNKSEVVTFQWIIQDEHFLEKWMEITHSDDKGVEDLEQLIITTFGALNNNDYYIEGLYEWYKCGHKIFDSMQKYFSYQEPERLKSCERLDTKSKPKSISAYINESRLNKLREDFINRLTFYGTFTKMAECFKQLDNGKLIFNQFYNGKTI